MLFTRVFPLHSLKTARITLCDLVGLSSVIFPSCSSVLEEVENTPDSLGRVPPFSSQEKHMWKAPASGEGGKRLVSWEVVRVDKKLERSFLLLSSPPTCTA